MSHYYIEKLLLWRPLFTRLSFSVALPLAHSRPLLCVCAFVLSAANENTKLNALHVSRTRSVFIFIYFCCCWCFVRQSFESYSLTFGIFAHPKPNRNNRYSVDIHVSELAPVSICFSLSPFLSHWDWLSEPLRWLLLWWQAHTHSVYLHVNRK